MYNGSQIINPFHYRLNKRNESEPLFKTKNINKIVSKKSSGNLTFQIKDFHYGKLISNIKNRTTKYLFNNIVYKSNEECEESPLYRPIEQKLTKLNNSQKINLLKIIPIKKLQNVIFKKLKPTPFEKNMDKKRYFKNVILMKQFENSYNDLKSESIRPFSLSIVKEKKMNKSCIYDNKPKSNRFKNKRALFNFNLRNIKQIEKKRKK